MPKCTEIKKTTSQNTNLTNKIRLFMSRLIGIKFLILRSRKAPRNHLGSGVIDTVIHQKQSWRVKFKGSYWFACTDDEVTLLPGTLVRVIGYRNISLIVEPM
jgi:membrane protein implicated in regulation of membrane protease activity